MKGTLDSLISHELELMRWFCGEERDLMVLRACSWRVEMIGQRCEKGNDFRGRCFLKT